MKTPNNLKVKIRYNEEQRKSLDILDIFKLKRKMGGDCNLEN